MFLPVSPPFFFMCRHDWSTPSNSICRTELWNSFSHFKAPSAFYSHFLHYLWASAASTSKCKPLLRIYVVFWSHKSFLLQNIYACILYIHSIYSFFLKSHLCFAQMTQMRSTHCVVKKTYCVTWIFGGSKSSTWSCQMWGFRVVWITQYEMALLHSLSSCKISCYFFPLYKSVRPLDWIIVFHSTSFHLLISILHFIRCN